MLLVRVRRFFYSPKFPWRTTNVCGGGARFITVRKTVFRFQLVRTTYWFRIALLSALHSSMQRIICADKPVGFISVLSIRISNQRASLDEKRKVERSEKEIASTPSRQPPNMCNVHVLTLNGITVANNDYTLSKHYSLESVKSLRKCICIFIQNICNIRIGGSARGTRKSLPCDRHEI